MLTTLEYASYRVTDDISTEIYKEPYGTLLSAMVSYKNGPGSGDNGKTLPLTALLCAASCVNGPSIA